MRICRRVIASISLLSLYLTATAAFSAPPATTRASVADQTGEDANRHSGRYYFSSHSSPYGRTYGEWSAKWWQFVLAIPAVDSPLLHDDKSAAYQRGPVWFLTGKFCLNSSCASFLPVVRSVTNPAEKAVFFPVANSEWDNLGVSPPLSVAEERAAAQASQDTVTAMSADLDGLAITSLDPLTSPFRVISPVFDYKLPNANLYQALGYPFGAQTVEDAVGDGVYVMLKPMTPGLHVLHFAASFNFDFAFDVTYYITVQPE